MNRITNDRWKKVFPANIKYFLEVKNISQKELAEKIGTTEAAMSRYVNGLRIPEITTAVNIADALGVSIEELF